MKVLRLFQNDCRDMSLFEYHWFSSGFVSAIHDARVGYLIICGCILEFVEDFLPVISFIFYEFEKNDFSSLFFPFSFFLCTLFALKF